MFASPNPGSPAGDGTSRSREKIPFDGLLVWKSRNALRLWSRTPIHRCSTGAGRRKPRSPMASTLRPPPCGRRAGSSPYRGPLRPSAPDAGSRCHPSVLDALAVLLAAGAAVGTGVLQRAVRASQDHLVAGVVPQDRPPGGQNTSPEASVPPLTRRDQVAIRPDRLTISAGQELPDSGVLDFAQAKHADSVESRQG
jgi:hypothetical protein